MRMLVRVSALMLVCMCVAASAQAQRLRVPEQVTAGSDVTIGVDGDATVYVAGPGFAAKRKATGGSLVIKGDELLKAGRYIIGANGDTAVMWVVAGPVKQMSFLAQPSRVPTSRQGVISGTTYLFDGYDNLVSTPTTVRFDLSVEGSSISRTATSRDGVAWTRMDSNRKEGAAQFVASTGDVKVNRVVREVAADPCNLRISAKPDKNGVLIETAPVRDCSGNAVPDGTIVTFTEYDAKGKTTVDARVKKGVASAVLPNTPGATISVASGVAVGNEIRWGGGGR